MKERRLGYYWVRSLNSIAPVEGGRWMVGEWTGEHWLLTGSDEFWDELAEQLEVRDRIEEPPA